MARFADGREDSRYDVQSDAITKSKISEITASVNDLNTRTDIIERALQEYLTDTMIPVKSDIRDQCMTIKNEMEVQYDMANLHTTDLRIYVNNLLQPILCSVLVRFLNIFGRWYVYETIDTTDGKIRIAKPRNPRNLVI